MYESFFHVTEEPFGVTPNSRFFFKSRKHDDALLSLMYGIERRKGFIMLTGEIGTGKTTLCRTLFNDLKKVDTALILNPTLTGGALLSAIVEDFGLKAKRSIKDRIDSINHFLLEGRVEGRNAVVIIDECQSLSKKALEMIRLLSNLETESEKLLQIVLVGQPELRGKLLDSDLRQLNQRIVVRHHLVPLDRMEVEQYICHRLRVAGAPEGLVKFSDGAIDLIYSYTKGFPRLINILCDRILMAAYVEEKTWIDAAIVSKSIKDVEGVSDISDDVSVNNTGYRRLFNIFRGPEARP